MTLALIVRLVVGIQQWRMKHVRSSDGREATGIKKAVCDCLATNGYSFETDVGMSSYPLDVAVHDPKNKNRFVLGVECDGEKYAAQHTVRDRDILRDSVLEGMGWKLFHAWSVDWTFDRKRAERRLLEVLPPTTNHGS